MTTRIGKVKPKETDYLAISEKKIIFWIWDSLKGDILTTPVLPALLSEPIAFLLSTLYHGGEIPPLQIPEDTPRWSLSLEFCFKCLHFSSTASLCRAASDLPETAATVGGEWGPSRAPALRWFLQWKFRFPLKNGKSEGDVGAASD